jgi:hypothetical protein
LTAATQSCTPSATRRMTFPTGPDIVPTLPITIGDVSLGGPGRGAAWPGASAPAGAVTDESAPVGVSPVGFSPAEPREGAGPRPAADSDGTRRVSPEGRAVCGPPASPAGPSAPVEDPEPASVPPRPAVDGAGATRSVRPLRGSLAPTGTSRVAGLFRAPAADPGARSARVPQAPTTRLSADRTANPRAAVPTTRAPFAVR